MMQNTELWVDRHMPSSLDEYVWKNAFLRQKIEEMITNGAPSNHLLFSGKSGTGKTTLALLMLKLMGVEPLDIMVINASRERKIEALEERVTQFCVTHPFGDMKYVVFDEADALSLLSQKFLRGEIESTQSCTRFIMTCNYPEKIVPPIRSRMTEFAFEALDVEEFVARLETILHKEGVEFSTDDLCDYVGRFYPDMRKTINTLQQYTVKGKLRAFSDDGAEAKDYLLEMVDLFRAGRFQEARRLIVEQAQIEEYPDIFRYCYKNLALWGDTPEQQDDALLVIRRGVLNHGQISDAELNLSAMLVELSRVRN